MPRITSEETYLPSGDELLEAIYEFLGDHKDRTAAESGHSARYFLTGPVPDDQVELPEQVYLALRKVVDAMRNGLAVSVVPQSTQLTTQQAADLLNVSRPTVVKLLDEGEIPFERPSTHRRIRLADLLAYREKRREQQYAILASTRSAVDEENLDSTLEELKAARKAIAARRAGAGTSA